MFRSFAILCLGALYLPAAQAPDHAAAKAHHQHGMALYRAHDTEGAIHELRQAVEIDAGSAEE